MYFTSGSDRAFEQLMQGKPGFDHYDSGEAVTPEECGTCRFYRPHWKYQFCVYAECPYQPGKLTAYDAVTFRVKGVENMAVFRVERNKGYTVMSNHHLRNKDLSLKAKGLLSQMLSLPEDWDYTLKGLSLINREQIDAIRAAIRELEQAGYIVRSRERDSQGRLRGADYVIYEQPQPVPDSPTLENPMLDNPTQEKPTLGKPTQLNKDISSKEKSITDVSITDPIPILSRPSPLEDEAAQPPERKGTEAKSQSAIEIYRQIIMDNIEYEHLCQHVKGIDRETLDEIVDLLVETVCSARKTIRIAGDDYPAELVKSKFMKLDSSHIEFVFDCLSKNTSEIEEMTRSLISRYSQISEDAQKLFQAERVVIGKCPRCGEAVYEGKKNYYCGNRACQFVMWKNDRFFEERGKTFTPKIAAALLKDGKAKVKGLRSMKTGKTYDGTVLLADTGGKYVNYRVEKKS